MGWKSTVDIPRSEAIRLIMKQMSEFDDKSNEELEQMLYGFEYGDDTNKEYFGYNFNVTNNG